MAVSRGLCKDMIKAYKSHFQDARKHHTQDINSARTVSQPFLVVNISCPSGSYDVNVEPSKDDVLFSDKENLTRLWDGLLRKFYHGKFRSSSPEDDDQKAPVDDSPQPGPAKRGLDQRLSVHQPSPTSQQRPVEDILPEQQLLSSPTPVKISPSQAETENPWNIAKARNTAVDINARHAPSQTPRLQTISPQRHHRLQANRSVTPDGRDFNSPIRRGRPPLQATKRMPKPKSRVRQPPDLDDDDLVPVSPRETPRDTRQSGIDTWLGGYGSPSKKATDQCPRGMTRKTNFRDPTPGFPNRQSPSPQLHDQLNNDNPVGDSEDQWREKKLMHNMRFGQPVHFPHAAKMGLPLSSQLPSPSPSPSPHKDFLDRRGPRRHHVDLTEGSPNAATPELAWSAQPRRDASNVSQSRSLSTGGSPPLESITPESAVHFLNAVLADGDLQKLSSHTDPAIHCVDTYDWTGQGFKDACETSQVSDILQKWKERLLDLMVQKFDQIDRDDAGYESLINDDAMVILLQRNQQ